MVPANLRVHEQGLDLFWRDCLTCHQRVGQTGRPLQLGWEGAKVAVLPMLRFWPFSVGGTDCEAFESKKNILGTISIWE